MNRENLLPFHLGYADELDRRMEDLTEAYYAESAAQVVEFVERYGVDVILVNREAFEQTTSKWERTPPFALLELASRCAVMPDGEVAVVPTDCFAAGS